MTSRLKKKFWIILPQVWKVSFSEACGERQFFPDYLLGTPQTREKQDEKNDHHGMHVGSLFSSFIS
jgi:hypothetical protein